jgi:hypothetical protein
MGDDGVARRSLTRLRGEIRMSTEPHDATPAVPRAARADAVLDTLANPRDFAVLAVVSLAVEPPTADDIEASITHLGLTTKDINRSVRILESLGLLSVEGGRFAMRHDTFTRVRDRMIDRDPVARVLRDMPDMRSYVTEGKIHRVPSGGANFRRFVEFAAACLPDFGRVSEGELNIHLRAITERHVDLRRLLVDAGVLQRDAAGHRYWWAADREGRSTSG